jgi:hypothetical protein
LFFSIYLGANRCVADAVLAGPGKIVMLLGRQHAGAAMEYKTEIAYERKHAVPVIRLHLAT